MDRIIEIHVINLLLICFDSVKKKNKTTNWRWHLVFFMSSIRNRTLLLYFYCLDIFLCGLAAEIKESECTFIFHSACLFFFSSDCLCVIPSQFELTQLHFKNQRMAVTFLVFRFFVLNTDNEANEFVTIAYLLCLTRIELDTVTRDFESFYASLF